jgi:hypothetical protein
MFPVTIIHREAQQRGLAYLVIGGHAVNAYCPPRATLDVDLLVRKSDAARWRDLLGAEGFKPVREADNFLQFSPPYGTDFRLDLMLVNETAFAKLLESAVGARCLGVDTLVPSALSLIALKIHALRHGPGERKSRDWLDIENLTRAAGLNPRSRDLSDVFHRQGTPQLYAEFLKRIGNE